MPHSPVPGICQDLIQAGQEAETGELRIRGQLGLHSESLSQKKKKKPSIGGSHL
jgi:hypothetical protein